MIVAESHRSRRLVGRLGRGEDLCAALLRVCAAQGVRSAELRVRGALEDAELREVDQAGRRFGATRRFDSPFTIVHLDGILAELDGAPHLAATCALARDRDNGIELVGGQLVRARVYAVEFVIEAFDDLVIERRADADTGLALVFRAAPATGAAAPATEAATPATGKSTPATSAPGPSASRPAGVASVPVAAASSHDGHARSFEAKASGHYAGHIAPVPVAAPAKPPVPASSATTLVLDRPVAAPAAKPDSPDAPAWLEVAQASGRQAQSAAESAALDEEPLRPGDVIDHPRFGHCEVERIEGNADYAQVRLKNRRVVRLSLDVLQLVREGTDERGHRRYRGLVST